MFASFVRQQLRPAVGLLAALTLLTGLVYPLAVTALAGALFPAQANGSLVTVDGVTVGSALVGQSFRSPEYLWGRPSAAGDGYDGTASGGSNLGPTSQALIDRVTAEAERWQAAHGGAPVPVDMVTASASGLDPHISPAAAESQVERIAAARGMPTDVVRAIIARSTEDAALGFLGRPRVNVLLVNLALDGHQP